MLSAEALVMTSETDEFMNAIEALLPTAYRLAYALVHRREEIDDILQEAAVSAWRHRRQVRDSAQLKPWFLAIVANQCKQAVRTRWWSVVRRPDLSSVTAGRSDPDSGDFDELRKALLRLKHRDRVVLVLRYYMDMSFDEVGETLRVSEQAARVRNHRALGRLRPILNSLEERHSHE
jgi:RNA polymerase sigma-70 factor, ECF subfamily